MNFATLSPQDRLKASVMIGVIVLVMIFFVHTIMGAVAPKKATKTNTTQTVQAAPPTPPQPGEATSTSTSASGEGGLFPLIDGGMDDPTGASGKVASDPTIKPVVNDPFFPLGGTASKTKAEPTPPTFRPTVSLNPGPTGGLNTGPFASGTLPWGPNQGNPRIGQGGEMFPAAVQTPEPPEPVIRVVGIVYGQPSVATLQVDNRTVLARPGEALAKGYRLMAIGEEGVVIRHDGQFTPLRSGGALNEAQLDAAKKPAGS